MLKKVLTIALFIALLFSMCITGYASDFSELKEPPEIGVKMTYINSAYTSLSISSSGQSNSYAMMIAYSSVDSVRISMYLQRYDNGWKTVKHWAQNFTGTTGSLSKAWYVTHGYEYRVLTYYYAYDGSSSESLKKVHDGVWY